MYHTVKTAAKRYQLNPRVIYREIEAGRLKALKIGDCSSKRPTYRLAESALEQWEASQTVGQK
jgi:hypothetical protein